MKKMGGGIPGSQDPPFGVLLKNRREFCVRFAQIGPLSCHPLKPNWTDPGQLVEPLFPLKHQSVPLKKQETQGRKEDLSVLYFFWNGPQKSRM